MDTESTGGKLAKGGGNDPKWDEGGDNEDEDDDREAATDVLTGVTCDSATGDSTAVSDDGGDRGLVGGEALAGLKVSGVKVLRTVGQEVEASHQQDGVDGQLPVVLEHLLDLVKEDFGLGLSRLFDIVLPLHPGAEEDLTLWKKGTENTGKSGDTGTGPEEGAPGGLGNEIQVDDGSDKVTARVTLLQDTAGNTTSFDGEVLEGGGGGETPDTTHTDTEETSKGEELREGLDEAGAEGEDGD